MVTTMDQHNNTGTKYKKNTCTGTCSNLEITDVVDEECFSEFYMGSNLSVLRILRKV